MPIFFIVGGYANGVSWRAARRDGRSYATWIESRLRRLVWPLMPLLVAWVSIVAIEYARGVRPELISYGSQIAFIPIWFFAVYIMIVLLVPAMEAAWTRFGMGSFWALTAAAIVLDILAYLIFQGRGMSERNLQQNEQARDQLRRLVGFSAADEIEKLGRLKKAGTITDAEFANLRARLVQ